MADWKAFWLREFLKILSGDYRIKTLFIQPSRFQVPFLWSRGQKRPFLIEKKNPNFFIYHPFHPLPLGRFRWIHYINSISLSMQIKYLIKKLELKNPFLFTTYPWWSIYLLRKCGERGNIFYYADEYAEYPGGTEKWKKFIYKLTEIHISSSDIVLAVNDHLLQKAKKLNKNSFLFPNAAPENLLSIELNEEGDREIILGYLGRINDRIDFELLSLVAENYPDFRIEFLGGIEAGAGKYTINGVNKLKTFPNVSFLPPVHQEKVGEHIKRWSLALIPLLINPLTMGISPLKLYEYCAIGLPVVSVKIPGVQPLKDVIYIAEDKKDFVKKIREAIEEDKTKKAKRKRAISEKYTWRHRVEEFITIVKKSYSIS